MAAKILAKGEVGEVPCEYCGKWFKFTGNGKWIPTICPECDEQSKCTFCGGHGRDPREVDLRLAAADALAVVAEKAVALLNNQGALREELIAALRQYWEAE